MESEERKMLTISDWRCWCLVLCFGFLTNCSGSSTVQEEDTALDDLAVFMEWSGSAWKSLNETMASGKRKESKT